MEEEKLNVAMFSIHSCPVGELGTQDTGGMNVYIRELAGELGHRGHHVDIYTRVHDPDDPQIIHLNENTRLIHLRAGKSGYLHKLAIYPYLDDFSGALERFILRENLHYDLVHSHYWLSGQVGRWAQARWNVPHIMMFHTLGAVKNTTGVGAQEPWLRITTERQIVQHCHRIIAATEIEKSELMRFYGADPEKMSVIPCGVNLDVFQPVNKTFARRQLGLADDEKIVLYVGRFAALKGIDRLLQAMTHLRHHKGLKLLIIGGDGQNAPASEALQRLGAELDIQDMVSFIGRIEQNRLPLYYSAADLLAVPSYHESFGLVALEALACGTPVVTTQVGAMDRIIGEGQTGSVVADSRPAAFAKAIHNFVSKPRPAMASVDSVRDSVRRFDWSQVANAMLEEYAGLLADFSLAQMPKISSQAAFI